MLKARIQAKEAKSKEEMKVKLDAMHKEWDVQDAKEAEARREANAKKRQEMETKAAEDAALKKQKLEEAGSLQGEAASVCRCGKPLERKTVQKNGPNWGRAYLTCAKGKREFGGCGYFDWILEDKAATTDDQAKEALEKPEKNEKTSSESSPVKVASSPSLCHCGKPLEQKFALKTGPNFGRAYLTCVQGKREFGGCGYFNWVGEDKVASTTGQAETAKEPIKESAAVEAGRPSGVLSLCRCGLQVERKTVQKSGANFGRLYMTCAKGKKEFGGCGFFDWISDANVATSDRQASDAPAKEQQMQTSAELGISVEVRCRCGELVTRKVCKKSGSSFGRSFLACEKGKKEFGGCGFFLWEAQDTIASGVVQAGA